jgi:magnesium transporter
VLDELNRLQGRITIDDIVDVIKEEAEKDYALASGISGNIESTDSVFVLTRARLPWLLIGLLGGILGARVIELYEGDLQLYPEMAFFIPLIAAMGGNVGVQSSAIIVQGLANNSLGLSGIWSKLWKEFSVALLNGVVCAAIIFGYNVLFSDSLALSYTVSLALFSVILVAALFGTFVPLVLDKYKIDPALATGPFITTVNDVLGLFIYFLIGHLLYIA